jgi:cytochrome P450
MITAIHDDLFAPEVMADPYTYLGQLRAEDPVHWNAKYGVWIVTRYDDVVWLLRHPELFSSEVFKRDPRPPYPPIAEADMDMFTFVRDFFADFFIQHDRPEHMAMRKVVHGYFTPKAQESWRPLVQSVIADLLDEVEAQGQMDVMRDFATPLPVLVIAQMLGMPHQDRRFIRELAEKLLFIGRGELNRMQPTVEGIKGLVEYLSPLVEERLANPGDDLLSVLASGEKSGAYTRDEVMANAVLLLLLAGHETTINLICNGTLAFVRHPEQWALLRHNPSLAVPATEECLRYDPPVKSLQRIAVQDVELQGKVVHALDRLRWFIPSANRDPEKFSAPDTFDITRHPNSHVAFGSGIHHCLGATLARLEGQEAFKALSQRFPRLYVTTEELPYHPSIVFRSLMTLPVAWEKSLRVAGLAGA